MINRISPWRCRLATADQENDVCFNKPLTNDLIFSSCGSTGFSLAIFFICREKEPKHRHRHTHTHARACAHAHICMLNIICTNKLGLSQLSRCRQSRIQGQRERFFLLGFGEFTHHSAACDSELSWAPNAQKLLLKSIRSTDFETSIWPHFAGKMTFSIPLH